MADDTTIPTEPTPSAQEETSTIESKQEEQSEPKPTEPTEAESEEEEESYRTVCISNLSDSLKEDQLRDLFKACGEIEILCIKLKLGEGRVCYIRFNNNDSAQTALLLNDQTLDSKPLQIKLIDDNILANYTPPNTNNTQSQNNSTNPNTNTNTTTATDINDKIDQQQTALETVQSMSTAKKPNQIASSNGNITLPNGLLPPDNIIRGAEEEERQEKLSRTIYVGNLNPMIQSEHLSEFFSVCGVVNLVKIAGNSTNPQAARYGFVEFSNLESARSAYNLSGHFLLDRPIKIGPAKNAILNPHPSKANIITNPVKINHAMAKVRLLQQRISNRYHSKSKSKSPDVKRDRDKDRERERDRDRVRRKRSHSGDRNDRDRSRSRRKRDRHREKRRDRDRDRDRDKNRDKKKRKKESKDIEKPECDTKVDKHSICKRNEKDNSNENKKKKDKKKDNNSNNSNNNNKKVNKSYRSSRDRDRDNRDRYSSRYNRYYSRSRSPEYHRKRRHKSRSRSNTQSRSRSRDRHNHKKRDKKNDKKMHKNKDKDKNKDSKKDVKDKDNAKDKDKNDNTNEEKAETTETNKKGGMLWDGFQWHPAPNINVADYRQSKYPPHLLHNKRMRDETLGILNVNSPNIQQAAALVASGTKLNTKYPPNPMNACPLVNPEIAAACAAAAAAAGKLTPQQATILKLATVNKAALIGTVKGNEGNRNGQQQSSLMAHQLSTNAVQQQMNKFFPSLINKNDS